MISSLHRFHGRASLRFVYNKGRVVRGQWFSIRVIENSKNQGYRAAVVVSKKVSKSAVVRNRIRRRIYEALRSLEAEINQPYDIVISVFSDIAETMPYKDLLSQLKKQLVEAGVLPKP